MSKFDFKSVTNITKDEFIGKWDGEELVLEPGETVKLEAPIATHMAKTMVADIIIKKENDLYWKEVKESGKKPHEVTRIIQPRSGEEFEKLMSEVLGEKKVDYSGMLKKDIIKLAEEKGLQTKKNGKVLGKDELIDMINNA